jgi:hypothetical protein
LFEGRGVGGKGCKVVFLVGVAGEVKELFTAVALLNVNKAIGDD